jgi:hypothetical protein
MIPGYLIVLAIVIHVFLSPIPSAHAQGISPFDTSKTALPANYDGQNFMSVFNKYSGKAKIEKGTYESTQEFNNRLEAGKANIYAFKKILKKESNQFDYDADKEKFTIRSNKWAEESGAIGGVEIYYNAREAGSYVASNALKQKVKVTKYDITMHVATGENWRSAKWINDEISFSYPRSDAKKLSNSLSALVIINPRSASIRDIEKTPTVNWPQEWKGKRYSLEGDLVDLWIFDDKSGKILFKYNAMAEERNRQARNREELRQKAKYDALKKAMNHVSPDGDWQKCEVDSRMSEPLECYYDLKNLKKKVSRGWGRGEKSNAILILNDDAPFNSGNSGRNNLLLFAPENEQRNLKEKVYFYAIAVQLNTFETSSREKVGTILILAVNYYDNEGNAISGYRYKDNSTDDYSRGSLYPYVINMLDCKNMRMQ